MTVTAASFLLKFGRQRSIHFSQIAEHFSLGLTTFIK